MGTKQADHEIISARLKSDQLEQEGKLFRDVASKLSSVSPSNFILLKGHSKCVTSVVFTSNGNYLFTASKDGTILKWDSKTCTKVHQFNRSPGGKKGQKEKEKFTCHSDSIFSLAISSNSKYLASGGKDKKINIYSVDSNELIKSFFHHKDSITGLVFRRGHEELFSSSMDRSVKLWNIAEMTYVESLFGHQEGILDLDCSVKERCISVGGRDRSLHLFKILDESQLVFRIDDGKYGSLNCCKMIDDEHFVCSTECSSLLLFSISKKKPVFEVKNAHEDGSMICSIGKIVFSNVIITGSTSGNIRIWEVGERRDSLALNQQFSINGFPNCISASYDGSLIAIAAGREPRLGRWDKRTDFVNGTFLIRLSE